MKKISNILLKKVTTLLLITILLFSTITTSFSAYFVDKATIRTDHLIDTLYLCHNGNPFRAYFVTYTGPDGKKYPAYCLQDGVDGPEVGAYTLTVTGYTNAKLWRAIRYGYPYSTPTQMGLSNADEAFYVTKQAVYIALGQRNINNFTANGSSNEDVLKALKNLVNKINIGTDNYKSPLYTCTSTSAKLDNLDSNYVSKTYIVSANADSTSIKISLTGTYPTGTKITDINNNAKTTFHVGDTFKVLVPKNQANLSVDFGIMIDGSIYTYPVLYADSRTSALQDNALVVDPLESASMMANFKATLGSNIIMLKTDKTTGAVLSGAKFKIYEDLNNNQILDETDTLIGETEATGTNGQVTYDNLPAGNYLAIESVVPKDYVLDTTPIPFTIDVGGTTVNVSATNTLAPGSLTITKTNKNKDLIDGAVFNLTGPDGYNKNHTVTNGKIIVENLKEGTYTIKEITAPTGYILNTESYQVKINPNETTTKSIVNGEPIGTINITKRDTEKGAIPQGDAKIENVTYQVFANEDIYNKAHTVKHYNKGDLVATRTTNSNGSMESVTGLPLGRYIVKEITPSLGYLLDTTVYTVNLVYDNQNTQIITKSVTSNEVVKKQQVHIFKSGIKEDSGEIKGLQGAEFSIKLFADVEKAKSLGYSYAEIWNGIDEDGNKVTVNASRVAQAQVIAPTYDTILTDTEGNAYTIDLPFGKYIAKETKIPKDYYSAVDFTFTISQDTSEIADVEKKVKHIIINNEQMEAYIKLVKKDLASGKIVTLSNATFEIKATKDIFDRGNGKLIYKAGDTIKQKIGSTTYTSFTTNADNVVIPDNSYVANTEDKGTVVTPLMLPVGSYEIIEVQVPNGFLRLDKPITFIIENIKNYDTDEYGDYLKEIVIKNEQPTATLLLNKTVISRENIDKSLINIKDFSGIKFELTAKENVIDMADGSTIYEKGKVVGEYNLTKDGKLRIEPLPLGVYEIQEIETINGLVLDTTKYEVQFTYEDTTTKVYTKELEVENKTTIFEISKTDITGENELEGAKLEIRDKNNKVIDSWTSTNKRHSIEGLVVGEAYTLIETLAPDEYVIATEIEFIVPDTAEMQKVHMIDKQVAISKTDLVTGEELEGAEMEIHDKDGNIIEKWTSSKEPHYVSGLVEGQTYTLIETTVPYGYYIAENIEFTISLDKDIQRIEMKDAPILTNIKIEKVDEETQEVIKNNKFIFGLYRDSECKDLIQEIEANTKEGTALFENFRYGTYYIKEIQAPKGYILSDEIIKIEINDIGMFINEKLLVESDGGYSFIFTNEKKPIIETGDNRNIDIFIKILILALIGLLYFAVKQTKEYFKKKGDGKKDGKIHSKSNNKNNR